MSELARLQRLIDHAFAACRWHVQDLTAAEFFAKPVTPCWGVWRRGESSRKDVLGNGTWVVDDHGKDTSLPATIGWRVLHLAEWTGIYREWTFGVRRPRGGDCEYPGTAAAAVEWLERAQDGFSKEVHALSPKDIDGLRPTHDGTKRSAGDLVWDIAVEHLHHGAEIGVLRDLIRGTARTDRYPGPWS